MAVLAVAAAMAGCADGPDTVGDALDDPQLPPRGQVDLLDWIDAGHYLAWRCEPAPHPARPGSGHGANRICSNDALVAAAEAGGSAPFPIGAAAVKEIFSSSGAIRLYAVYRKVAATSDGYSWYWYEGDGDSNYANGVGDSTCTGCHSNAPRDFVFTVVR